MYVCMYVCDGEQTNMWMCVKNNFDSASKIILSAYLSLCSKQHAINGNRNKSQPSIPSSFLCIDSCSTIIIVLNCLLMDSSWIIHALLFSFAPVLPSLLMTNALHFCNMYLLLRLIKVHYGDIQQKNNGKTAKIQRLKAFLRV